MTSLLFLSLAVNQAQILAVPAKHVCAWILPLGLCGHFPGHTFIALGLLYFIGFPGVHPGPSARMNLKHVSIKLLCSASPKPASTHTHTRAHTSLSMLYNELTTASTAPSHATWTCKPRVRENVLKLITWRKAGQATVLFPSSFSYLLLLQLQDLTSQA